MARPTKYHEGMIKTAQKYIDSCEWKTKKVVSIEGLALVLGCDDEQISIWAKQHPNFSATVKRLKAKQKEQLISDGFYLGKDVNAVMAIFLLKVNHGMIETNNLDVRTMGKSILEGASKNVPKNDSNK